MLQLLTPHLQLDNVLELSPETLRSLNRRGVLLDVDCTLKDYCESTFSPAIANWVYSLRVAGVHACLLSNGKARRIARLAHDLRIPFVAKAFKPLPFGCRAALRLLDLPAEQVALVGDQVFADILAGRLAGLFTILVRPTSLIEPVWTRVKRPFERFVLKRLPAPPHVCANRKSDCASTHGNASFALPCD